METLPEPGIYQHYKSKLYHVIDVARHSEILEPCIVYRRLYDDYGMWGHLLRIFLEYIDVKGASVPRFKFLHKIGLASV